MDLQLLRNYEVSIWTLQDSFITVLKHANLELKGQIQNPIVKIKDDGTREFTFSIPMYLYNGTELVENPNWYNTTNGNLMVGLRKIKVICDKKTENEKVFEFVITKVTETHQTETLVCNIECQGLAFHELGKIGYKISLTAEDFYDDYDKWLESNPPEGEEFIANLPYWMDKVLATKTDWHYDVEMDWINYDGIVLQLYGDEDAFRITGDEPSDSPLGWLDISHLSNTYWPTQINNAARVGFAYIDQDYIGGKREANIIPYSEIPMEIRDLLNEARQTAGYRRYDTLYEEPYVTDWSLVEGQLVGAGYESYKEKARLVNLEESNIYNLTQSLAEIFGVFVRYEYSYDENYHIIDKRIVFYNNFLKEADGTLDITYRYDSNNISRTMDSADVITKMYVPLITDDTLATGSISITDAKVNPLLEDYLLNFDYLYSTNIISQEQYEYLDYFRTNVRAQNDIIIPLQNEIMELNNRITELEGELQFYTNAVAKDVELLAQNGELMAAITNNTGIVTVDSSNPEISVLIPRENQSNSYYINLRQQGIKDSPPVRVYRTYIASTHTLGSEISQSNISLITDEFGNITGLNVNVQLDSTSKTVYLTYQYNPKLWYERVEAAYAARLTMDTGNKERTENILEELKEQLADDEEDCVDALEVKKQLLSEFEVILGPAVREGVWRADDYDDYGTHYQKEISNSNIEWSEPFKWETGLTYKEGAQQTEKVYPFFFLPSNQIQNILDYNNTISVCYNSVVTLVDEPSITFRQRLMLGSACELGYINDNNVYKPAIILTGMAALSDAEQAKIIDNSYKPTLSYIDGNNVEHELMSLYANGSSLIIIPNDPTLYTRVYPRYAINSLKLQTSSDLFKIILNDEELEMFVDYSLLTNEDCYYVTLKPLVALDSFTGTIYYQISNADTMIYLDAINILQENSWPKVSYNVNLTFYNQKFLKQVSSLLNHLVRINDTELKFEHVEGYISELTLDLDHPWKDQAVIKNYKNKFEDLFSTIVAQTEEMKKSSPLISMVSSYFVNGSLSKEVLNKTLLSNSEVMNNYFDTMFNNKMQNDVLVQKILNDTEQTLVDLQLAVNQTAQLAAQSKVIRSQTAPLDAHYGDVWVQTDSQDAEIGYYFAMNGTNGIGWNQIREEGELNGLSGAKFSLNTDSGEIQITANNVVNIGGGIVNIGASSGINLMVNNGNQEIANVQLSGQSIDLGISSAQASSGSIIKLNKEKIILAAGTTAENIIETNGITTANTVAGMEITPSSMKFATVANNTRNLISMDSQGLILASYNISSTPAVLSSSISILPTSLTLTSGSSSVSISPNLLSITSGDFRVTTTNLVIDSTSVSDGQYGSASIYLGKLGLSFGQHIKYSKDGTIDITSQSDNTNLFRFTGDKLVLSNIEANNIFYKPSSTSIVYTEVSTITKFQECINKLQSNLYSYAEIQINANFSNAEQNSTIIIENLRIPYLKITSSNSTRRKIPNLCFRYCTGSIYCYNLFFNGANQFSTDNFITVNKSRAISAEFGSLAITVNKCWFNSVDYGLVSLGNTRISWYGDSSDANTAGSCGNFAYALAGGLIIIDGKIPTVSSGGQTKVEEESGIVLMPGSVTPSGGGGGTTPVVTQTLNKSFSLPFGNNEQGVYYAFPTVNNTATSSSMNLSVLNGKTIDTISLTLQRIPGGIVYQNIRTEISNNTGGQAFTTDYILPYNSNDVLSITDIPPAFINTQSNNLTNFILYFKDPEYQSTTGGNSRNYTGYNYNATFTLTITYH